MRTVYGRPERYSPQIIVLFKERGVNIPENGDFKVGVDCPGEKYCQKCCLGDEGVAIKHGVTLPCQNLYYLLPRGDGSFVCKICK